MKTLFRVLIRFLLRHWFALLLVGIATYVVFQKELRVVLYFQKPGEEVPAGLAVEKEPYAEAGKEPDRANRFNLFSWGNDTEVSRVSMDFSAALRQIPQEDQLKYLKRFARVAIAERKKFGLPSSVILAMALLHSTAGRDELARQANNHFALSCSDFWEGDKVHVRGNCYRAYENAWSSFRDFSLFAAQLNSAESRIPPTDHFAWSKRLEQAGVSPVPNLSEEIERIIQAFQLYELDVK